MKIFVAGLTGTGKSSLSSKLAKKFDIEYLPSSMYFRKFIGKDTNTNGWWTHSEGLEFMKERLDSDFDERFDKYLLNIIDEKEDFVIDSWTLPWLYKEEGLRILLTTPFEIRVQRVMLRDDLDYDDAKISVKQKDYMTKMIYLKKYGFDILKDRNIFDLVVNTQYLTEKEVFSFIAKYVSKYENFFR